jgi:hypothetical protein
MSDIERVRGLRRRLEQGRGLTVVEAGLLLDEVERVHASREACVHTISRLRAELEGLGHSPTGSGRD